MNPNEPSGIKPDRQADTSSPIFLEGHPTPTFFNFLGQRTDRGTLTKERARRLLFPRDSGDFEKNKIILADHGLAITPDQVNFDFGTWAREFDDDDWEYIKKATDTLAALYTVTNYYRSIVFTDRYKTTPYETAALRTLPLVYQTNYDKLQKILADGKIIPDKKFQEMNIPTSRIDEIKVEMSGGHLTNTYSFDREAGLDEYVFTYFGRPHPTRQYGSIQILLKQDRFHQDERAFATQDDIADLVHKDGGMDKYRDQFMQGMYFLRSAAKKIKWEICSRSIGDMRTNILDPFLNGSIDRKDSLGFSCFSTWEVKVPGFSTDDIEAIVFTDEEEYDDFNEKYPGQYRTILKTTSTDPNQVYTLEQKDEEEYDAIIIKELEKGHGNRAKKLEDVPEEGRTPIYVEVLCLSKYISRKGDINMMEPIKTYNSLGDAIEGLQETGVVVKLVTTRDEAAKFLKYPFNNREINVFQIEDIITPESTESI